MQSIIQQEKKSKHGNKKTPRTVNGKIKYFDSKKEAERYDELMLLLRSKKISELDLQPEFILCDTQRHNGITYPKVKYVSDFMYRQNGKTIVEDVKSEHTKKLDTYRVKIKWFLSIYGDKLTFRET